jgi:phosphatidate cytidylyltransferase
MRTRLLTGIVLIACLLGVAWADARVAPLRIRPGVEFDGLLFLGIAALLLAPVLAIEFSRMARGAGVRASALVCVLAAVMGCLSVAGASWAETPRQLALLMALPPLGAVAFAAIAATRGQQVDGIAAACGAAALSYVLIGLSLGCWSALRSDTDAWTLAAVILVVKSSDIGAYFTGHAIGRHKLIPWLSPGKTWEGFVGGVALAAGVGAALGAWGALPAITLQAGVALGLVMGFVGPFGDLLESALKRGAGMKDSGRIIPGMGGLFDVLDSLLMAGPVAWLLIVPPAPSATLTGP